MNYQSLESTNVSSLKYYYKIHSRIYDLSRWSFLFGRKELINYVSKYSAPKKILEVGCGTGTNLILLNRYFPEAELWGLDISADMLEIANKKLSEYNARFYLLEKNYNSPLKSSSFELIIFSYCLSMINPGWENALSSAKENLAQDGIIAVVDFDGSNYTFFRKWMALNHVRMEYHIPEFLSKHFTRKFFKSASSYSGLWQYFLFIGGK